MSAAAPLPRLSAAAFAVGLALQAGCAGFRSCPDAWWGADKLQHFAAAAVIGAGGAALASARLEPEESFAVGWSAGMLAGTGKEWRDLHVKNTCWSWQDLFWDCLGAAAGASVAWGLD